VKTVSDTFAVSRSNLIERLELAAKARSTYVKPDDEWLLTLIRELVDERPTYGYRRITALLNRRFRKAGKPSVNHKRIYRIMIGQPAASEADRSRTRRRGSNPAFEHALVLRWVRNPLLEP
jgi:hypothetical protein